MSSVTGTLTQNEMVFKRLHLGTVSYGTDTMDEVQNHVRNAYSQVSWRLCSRHRLLCTLPGFCPQLSVPHPPSSVPV